jgi:hypothetical protein
MKFRKKPVIIDAWLNHRENDAAMPKWCSDAVSNVGFDGILYIKTLEGMMRADHGDWIIRGVKGEVYPCKPDIFAETYEPVDAVDPNIVYPDKADLRGPFPEESA